MQLQGSCKYHFKSSIRRLPSSIATLHYTSRFISVGVDFASHLGGYGRAFVIYARARGVANRLAAETLRNTSRICRDCSARAPRRAGAESPVAGRRARASGMASEARWRAGRRQGAAAAGADGPVDKILLVILI